MTPRLLRNDPRTGENPAHLSVLIVDDEPLIRWSLKEALRSHGHDVATAANGAEALALVASPGQFDVVILDYRLPDRRDLSLLDDIQLASPHSAVFMMTAFADDDMRAGAQERGVRAVIGKPFQVKSFVSLIESAVRS
jgi:DNA-binding NtrC family response regulator